MIEAIAALLKEALEVFQLSGGPDKLKDWVLGKIPELKAIRAQLTPPDQP